MKSSRFRAITSAPLNGASHIGALVDTHITNVADFFVRNHGDPAGTVNATGAPAPWTVHVNGLVRTPLEISGTTPLTTQSLLAFAPRTSIAASLQCAGNRRTALFAVKPIPGEIPWDNAAIGTAVWGGVRLADVLQHAHVLDGAAHVWFIGADVLDGKHAGQQFGASIPLAKALHPSTLLADRMNNAPLVADHGAPVRVIVPGFIGARSVKWLTEIRVEREPSPNYFQSAYSVRDIALDEFPVSSAFGSPADNAAVAAGKVSIKGWSITGGDRTVAAVEVSADGGVTWSPAQFDTPATPYVWRLWHAECALAPGTHQLVCRAVDSEGNGQPDAATTTWNTKGYVNNCWDRVTVRAS